MKQKRHIRVRQFWGRNFLLCEAILVLFAWVIFLVWARYFDGEQSVVKILDGRRGLIYGTVATIAGSLLGFVIAAQSIVLGFSGNEKLDIVRKSRHHPTLWRVFRWSIRTLAVATMTAVAALIFDCDRSPCTFWLYACLLATMVAVIQLARTIWILEQVVRIVSAEKKSAAG